MKRTAAFLVNRRRILLAFFLALAAVSLVLAGRVTINYDLTEYLPEDSRMKQGMQLMEGEFGPAVSSDLRVMLTGLSEEEKAEALQWFSGLEQVASVAWEPGEGYNRGEYTLYEITTEYDSHSVEASALYRTVHGKYGGAGAVTGGSIHEANVPLLPLYIIIVAVGLVLLILLMTCNSWFEPVIFLVNIGIAVAVNLGTNVLFASISEYTNSIVGIMQLVLSMDYSIILLNRYTQEKEKNPDNPAAMKAAIAAAFPAVAGSSLTTFAGLLCMAFMRFRLGADMGFALAKGVVVSLVCIFTVLPSLILMSDRWIEKTRKKNLHIPMKAYSRFAVRGRFAYFLLFLALFAGAFFLKNNTEIQYMLEMNNPVDAAFEKRHSLVLLYETKDSSRIGEVLAPLEKDDKVTGMTGYFNTIGKAYRAEEIAEMFSGTAPMDANMVSMLFQMYAAKTGSAGEPVMTLPELISFIQEDVLANPFYAAMINEETKQQIAGAGDMIRENAAKLEGGHYGRVIITTVYPEDSPETRDFIRMLSERSESLLQGHTWLIGTSVMNDEMAKTFNDELNRITIFSAVAIFFVVALTFRSLIIPLILVPTVQCGIYLTMSFAGLTGSGMYYLAILMVQCILIGATIDYGILYTSYYLEYRRHAGCSEAICSAYDGALHTILTSALIMILAAGALGFVFANPAIGEICLTISRGAISATLLIILILPGVLAAADRFITRERR